MLKISHVSQQRAEQDLNIRESWKGVAFISIADGIRQHPPLINFLERGGVKAKRLKFEDIDSKEIPHISTKNRVIFSDEDAKKLIKFIDECFFEGVNEFYIHCLAGISRSSAVALFVMFYSKRHESEIEFDWVNFLTNAMPNSLVFHKLLINSNLTDMEKEQYKRKFESYAGKIDLIYKNL